MEIDSSLLPMFEVAIIGRAGSQALGEVCHRLVDVAPRWSAKRLSTNQSSRSSAGLYGTFPAWRPRRGSPLGSNLESLGPLILFNELRTVRLQPILRDARRVSCGAVLLKDEACRQETLAICDQLIQASDDQRSSRRSL